MSTRDFGILADLKRLALHTPLYRAYHRINDALVSRAVARTTSTLRPMLFCISPYKSGTTYFCQLLGGVRAKHEPLHEPTLKRLFDDEFLDRRRAYLDLDAECSGFFALRAEEIMQRWSSDRFIMLARDPLEWAASVADYFSTPRFRRMRYNYIDVYFLSRIDARGLASFREISGPDRLRMMESLLIFWRDVYSAGMAAENCLVVALSDIRPRRAEIEAHCGVTLVLDGDVWTRKNADRSDNATDAFGVAGSDLLAECRALYSRIKADAGGPDGAPPAR